MPLINQSTMLKQQFANVSVDPTAAGASADVDGIFDPLPMCMLIVTWASLQASKNGSQWPLWMLGRPRFEGISLKQTACTPRSALRRISAAASTGSHNGT